MAKSEYRIPSRRRSGDRSVSATDAAKNFGELLDKVRESGAPYIVERQGRAMVALTPIVESRCTLSELVAWLDSRRALPDEYRAAVADGVAVANRPQVPESRWER